MRQPTAAQRRAETLAPAPTYDGVRGSPTINHGTPMDPIPIAGMIFSLLTIMMIGGFILLFPITRRLGAYLEQRLDQGKRGADGAELRQLRASLAALQSEVERLAERQEFTDSLLAAPQRSAGGTLPRGSGSAPSPTASPDPEA